MLIGELSRRTGASRKAIRMYEAGGLLAPVQRRGSYRLYSDLHVRQVGMIRQAQALGIRLSDWGAVLTPGGAAPDWEAVLQALARKRDGVREEIRMLKQRETELDRMAAEIRACLVADPPDSTSRCP